MTECPIVANLGDMGMQVMVTKMKREKTKAKVSATLLSVGMMALLLFGGCDDRDRRVPFFGPNLRGLESPFTSTRSSREFASRGDRGRFGDPRGRGPVTPERKVPEDKDKPPKVKVVESPYGDDCGPENGDPDYDCVAGDKDPHPHDSLGALQAIIHFPTPDENPEIGFSTTDMRNLFARDKDELEDIAARMKIDPRGMSRDEMVTRILQQAAYYAANGSHGFYFVNVRSTEAQNFEVAFGADYFDKYDGEASETSQRVLPTQGNRPLGWFGEAEKSKATAADATEPRDKQLVLNGKIGLMLPAYDDKSTLVASPNDDDEDDNNVLINQTFVDTKRQSADLVYGYATTDPPEGMILLRNGETSINAVGTRDILGLVAVDPIADGINLFGRVPLLGGLAEGTANGIRRVGRGVLGVLDPTLDTLIFDLLDEGESKSNRDEAGDAQRFNQIWVAACWKSCNGKLFFIDRDSGEGQQGIPPLRTGPLPKKTRDAKLMNSHGVIFKNMHLSYADFIRATRWGRPSGGSDSVTISFAGTPPALAAARAAVIGDDPPDNDGNVDRAQQDPDAFVADLTDRLVTREEYEEMVNRLAAVEDRTAALEKLHELEEDVQTGDADGANPLGMLIEKAAKGINDPECSAFAAAVEGQEVADGKWEINLRVVCLSEEQYDKVAEELFGTEEADEE